MERKIGEIFKYNNEWYQTVEAPIDEHSCNGCSGCKGIGGPRIFGGECDGNARKDGKFVIFKKLKKVGEPCEFQKRTIQTYKLYTEPFISFDMDFICTYLEGSNTIDIEIKQTKEDMETNKSMKEKLMEYLESATEEKLKDDFEALKKFNELGISVQEFIKLQMSHHLKPFDLEAAKAGKPVCTRDGRKARIVCFDRNDLYPIVALIECEDGKEIIGAYSKEGQTEIYEIKGTDLMMLPEKKEGWVNVMEGNNGKSYVGNDIYTTEDKAKEGALRFTSKLINTIKISWE